MYVYATRSPLNIVHAGLDLVRSELEAFDESATAIVISPETAKMVGQIFIASESAIDILNDLLNYEHIDSGTDSSSSSQQCEAMLTVVLGLLGTFKLELAWQPLTNCSERNLTWAKILAEEKGIQIEVDNGMITMGSRGLPDSSSESKDLLSLRITLIFKKGGMPNVLSR